MPAKSDPNRVTIQGEGSRKVFRITINAPIHEVWREITRTDAPIAAFFNSRLDTPMLSPGSKLAMRTPDGRFTGVVGKILEVVPPTRFAHTFKFTNLDDPECTVVYELREVGGATEFTLTIEDLPIGTKTGKQMTGGSKMILSTLKATVELGRPTLGTRILFRVMKLAQPLTPARCRSENWPVR